MASKTILTRKRILKGQITKLKEKTNSIYTQCDIAELELINKKCEKFSEELSDVFNQIYETAEEKEIEAHLAEQDAIQTTIDEILLKVARQISSRKSNSDHSISTCSQQSEPKVVGNVKLPKLSLPIFSGNLHEWLTFADLFKASVHNNDYLSDAQKLQYLKSSLRGDAFRIIQSIAISDSNYETAWKLLEDRFSNKREQIFAHIKRLISIPSMHSESSSAILNLVDTINEITHSLELLEQKIENFSDTLFMYIILQKLDNSTKMWFERQLQKENIPKLNELIEFLKDHARTLQHNKPFQKKPVQTKTTVLMSKCVCSYCNEEHKIQNCSKFLNLHVQKRIEFVKNNYLCFNCLSNHRIKMCKSVNKCKHCGKFHHSLLHIVNQQTEKQSLNPQASAFYPQNVEGKKDESPNETICASLYENHSSAIDKMKRKQKQVLLCTALIRVKNSMNELVYCRALLDTGSQASFISKQCVNNLGLEVKEGNITISCVGALNSVTSGKVDLLFAPHFESNMRVSTSAFVIEKITDKSPQVSLPKNIRDQFKNFKLADPNFYNSQPIDILLGVNVFLTLLNGSVVKKNSNLPFAVSSQLGWIIAGTMFLESSELNEVAVNYVNTNDLIQRFWELEEVPNARILTTEETLCERQFEQQHIREKSGRYSVSLPFKPNRGILGESKKMATRRFLNLEKRLLSMPEIYQQYKEFMHEYLVLDHMEEVTEDISNSDNEHYYMPHHYILKEARLTTKLRVVFDASAKTSSGLSLNDILMVGPKLQDDLFFILLRFRCHNIAITADLQKMYRQIRVKSSDRNFQRIIWRNTVEETLKIFRLCTVTYGTASAPYLAIRALHQLANDEISDFPIAANSVLHDMYVDDILTGTENVKKGTELVIQLTQLLKKGGFELHKWFSNEEIILKRAGIIDNAENISNTTQNKTINLLGLEWHPSEDEFSCNFTMPVTENCMNKRMVLSIIASIFDPLGWIAPFVVAAKIFMQELWKLELSWDECIPEDQQNKWKIICDELLVLKTIRIPRKVLLWNASKIELHAFCDASEKAYGTVIYVRSVSRNNDIDVKLLTAKTRVAPLKSISIPRLELQAALLLARLVHVIKNSLPVKMHGIHAWTDSTIVLSWLNAEPSKWQTFVANRVSEIQKSVPTTQWNHINGKENPADCASRGLLASSLINHHLWWTGPSWLKSSDIPFSRDIHLNQEALKEKRKTISCTNIQVQPELPIITKISSISKLQRIIAWCLRFLNNARKPIQHRQFGLLSMFEISKATTAILKSVQIQYFSEEIHALKHERPLKASSKILPLNPFLDSDEILRVGGRLKHAHITEDQKHPIILPKSHHVTTAIIQHYHITHLHAGPQLLLAALRTKFWILNGRDAIRKFIKSCVKCFRASPKTATQLMGDLPSSRVLMNRPFTITGIDYAGPFACKSRNGRGIKSFKVYIAIFVCFSTRAIHLELVTDLSTPAFIAALKRFVARRGKPSEIFSDCATNFKGASNELKERYKLLSSFQKNQELNHYTTREGISWKFNPPSSPHFGGLWEAGVKAVKRHLRKNMGNLILTFEEFSTLLAQIEACLNSRPLCTLSNDPNDLQVLTPGHFLTGAPLTAIPEPNVCDTPISRLRRWETVQQVFQHFWKRWHNEYLSNFQQRSKWCQSKDSLKVGDLVLIKMENVPPLQWKLGRITETFPGSDGHVRVVTVKTAHGELKRPIHKLCLLPLNNS